MTLTKDAIIGLWVDGAITTNEMKRRLHRIGLIAGLRRAARLKYEPFPPDSPTHISWNNGQQDHMKLCAAEARRLAKGKK